MSSGFEVNQSAGEIAKWVKAIDADLKLAEISWQQRPKKLLIVGSLMDSDDRQKHIHQK